ncbi:MAG: hypothetical protein KDB16_01100 [Acidimicrobiales bacterium]|nr:hypothetical protein [Acidimicrobiales bacterium]
MTAESAKRVLAAALATLLLVAACDSTQDRGNELPTTSVVETTASTVEEIAEAKGLTSDGPLLVAARAPDVINAAGLGGTIEIVDGCVYLTEGPGRDLVGWPFGTRWDDENQQIVLADGQTIEAGDRILGGGGGYSVLQALEAADASAVALLERCREMLGASVVSGFGRVTSIEAGG